jgi:acetoin utilization deacetylase AcuC-like enzyme
MTELLAIEQRPGRDDDAPWVVEGGKRIEGQENGRRLAALQDGLGRHPGVRTEIADAGDEQVERTLRALHDRRYLAALRGVETEEHFLMPEFATPGLAPDVPVNAALVAAAHEGVRTAVTAAARLVAGARLTYAVCRPPGHHAGPAWFGGYCYLNNAAAAVRVLVEGGIEPIAVLDLDLHYPNGTAALLAPMPEVTLHSLHHSPVTNVPADTVLPWAEREEVVAFAEPPSPDEYLEAVADSLETLAEGAGALVLSLGYDTVTGDPHGSWELPPETFSSIGALVAATGLPVCVIQEGGYALSTLADCSYAFATGLLEAPDGPKTGDRLPFSARRPGVSA